MSDQQNKPSSESESKEPEKSKGVGELIPLLMQRIGIIGKERKNQNQNYQFRGIDDVLSFVGPPCAALGLRCEIQIDDYHRENDDNGTGQGGARKFIITVTLKLIAKFTAPDGSSHTIQAIGEGMDHNGDKATNKAMANAFKYACFLGFIIPVEGVINDGDVEGLKATDKRVPGARAVSPKARKQLEQANGTDEQPEGVIDPEDRIATITKNQLKAIAALKLILKWSDKKMKECVSIVSPGNDNAANLTIEEASELITRMQGVIDTKSKSQQP